MVIFGLRWERKILVGYLGASFDEQKMLFVVFRKCDGKLGKNEREMERVAVAKLNCVLHLIFIFFKF